MQRFLPHRFELTSVSGTLPVTEIYRDCYPAVGDQLVIFNYSNVEPTPLSGLTPGQGVGSMIISSRLRSRFG